MIDQEALMDSVPGHQIRNGEQGPDTRSKSARPCCKSTAQRCRLCHYSRSKALDDATGLRESELRLSGLNLLESNLATDENERATQNRGNERCRYDGWIMRQD